MGWTVFANLGHKRGADVGPGSARKQEMAKIDQLRKFGFGLQRDRPDPPCVEDFQSGPQRSCTSGHHRHVSGRSRVHEPGLFWDPVQERHYQLREVAPQRRLGIFAHGGQPRTKAIRFQSDRSEPRQAIVPTRKPFPFTVFGKGRSNKPDPATHRPNMFGQRGRNDRDGQHVGKDIMQKYVFKSALKKGGMAEAVSVVKEKQTGNIFVQKYIPLRGPYLKRTRAEINTLLKIDARGRHENLNAIIESEISESRQKCFIILEYCDMGSIQDEITSLRRCREHAHES